MLFSSLPFQFFFLPLFFIAYYLAKKRAHRNFIMLGFSLFFYAWGEPVYIFLMLFSIFANYFFAVLIDRYQSENQSKSAKYMLIFTVIVNLTLIGIFKYSGFIVNIFTGIFGLGHVNISVPLPIGISFYTFQILSYVIDVYNKKVKVQKNMLFLGTYLTGFTHLVAGPIVRYQTIEYELEHRVENMTDFAEGLRRFTAGLAKKILIANTMAEICDNMLDKYNNGLSDSVGALGMWLAVIAYALQIYYDFSGYSDMAIGIGRMLGFHYLENFNYPYIAKSVTDFWRRWHMSLSTFFRDYVYIPLGGNRVKTPRWVLNMMVVWLLTGLWHGANWTFVLWGVYFGVLLIVEKMFLQNNLLKIPVLNHIYAIAAFMFGWIIFRAESVPQIGAILSGMFGAHGGGSMLKLAENGLLKPIHIVMLIAGIICATPVSRKLKEFLIKNGKAVFVIDIASAAALVTCIVVLMQGAYNPFIYFRF